MEEQKTAAQIAAERIMNAPLDPEYEPVEDIPVPLGRSVIMQSVKGHEMIINSSGIILPKNAKNTVTPNEGIVISVGPECSKYIRPGLRYQYSMHVDTGFMHTNGKTYPYMDEMLVFFCKLSPIATDMGVIPDRHLQRAEKQERQAKWMNQDHADNMNEMDKAFDKTKGKTKPVRNNLKK